MNITRKQAEGILDECMGVKPERQGTAKGGGRGKKCNCGHTMTCHGCGEQGSFFRCGKCLVTTIEQAGETIKRDTEETTHAATIREIAEALSREPPNVEIRILGKRVLCDSVKATESALWALIGGKPGETSG